jgi:hypothetical protein
MHVSERTGSNGYRKKIKYEAVFTEPHHFDATLVQFPVPG